MPDLIETKVFVAAMVAICLYLFEIVLLYSSYPYEFFEDNEFNDLDDSEKSRVSDLRGRALTLTGLAVACSTFLLSDQLARGDLMASLVVFGISIAFLMVAFQLGEYAVHHRLWYVIQDHTTSYGLFLFCLGFLGLFIVYVPSGVIFLAAGFGLVFFLRVYSTRSMLHEHQMEAGREYTEEAKEFHPLIWYSPGLVRGITYGGSYLILNEITSQFYTSAIPIPHFAISFVVFLAMLAVIEKISSD